ncbi:MAG: TIGR04282 family arsenosugar biosynthesis glycosyltransferase [Gemmataceae bacterium]
MPQEVLAVFAKQPIAGKVKTRLATDSSPAFAAEVATALLLDLTNRLANLRYSLFLVFDPPESRGYFTTHFDPRFTLIPQGDGDLGQRLARFIDNQVQAGVERLVILGADSPSVPTAFIDEAFGKLRKVDVVLGPASDGGYYLLGCSGRTPPIFEGISWGSPDVLAQTIKHLADPSWKLGLLPPWYDVDTIADWRMLCGHVQALRRAGINPGLPHTERLLFKPSQY